MRKSSKAASIAGWIIAVLLFMAFALSGTIKLTAQPMPVQLFTVAFGYPLWFMYLTGAIEVASAVLVIVPRTSWIGAALLVCVMIGALYSHLTHGQAAMIAAPAVLLILAAVELLLRRPNAPAPGYARTTR